MLYMNNTRIHVCTYGFNCAKLHPSSKYMIESLPYGTYMFYIIKIHVVWRYKCIFPGIQTSIGLALHQNSIIHSFELISILHPKRFDHPPLPSST